MAGFETRSPAAASWQRPGAEFLSARERRISLLRSGGLPSPALRRQGPPGALLIYTWEASPPESRPVVMRRPTRPPRPLRTLLSSLFAVAVACTALPLLGGIITRAQSTGGQAAVSPQGATAGQQVPQRPVFRAGANFVRVDVYPTADGHPVEDLRKQDFDVLEDGRLQTIDTFEHIVVRPAGPQELRAEPATVAESRAMAQSARARLFVIFLDFNHVDVSGSHNIRQPLITALDRALGDDDLVAVMTPEMDARQITFARKTTTIETILTKYWTWGERFQTVAKDPIDDKYSACYPGLGPTLKCADDDRGVADEMIERRKEKQTLGALRDLVGYLRTVREERKAVLTITEGWALFRPDPTLARRLYCRAASGSSVVVDPRTGKLAFDRDLPGDSGCDGDRLMFSQLDDDRTFRDLLDEANRSNVSFYPIDPRGLAAFDGPIMKSYRGAPPPGSTTMTPPSEDLANLRGRLESLRTLAGATDGIATLDSNDLAGNLSRVVGDLTSYYLLGYYSDGKLDGKFHRITVRVKRPGVDVRARRGYRALTEEESRAPAAVAAPVDPEVAARNAAFGDLATIRSSSPIHFRAGSVFVGVTSDPAETPSRSGGGSVWLAAELDANRSLTREWENDATVSVTMTSSDRKLVATGESRLAPGARSVLLRLPDRATLPPGDYTVVVKARSGGSALITESIAVALPAPGSPVSLGDPALFRRGPFSGPGWQPVGDVRFRRQERIQVRVAVTGAASLAQEDTAEVHLLGRNGEAIDVPIEVSPGSAPARPDDPGTRADVPAVIGTLSLAPLAPADYVLQVALTHGGARQERFVAFRIVP
jgi:VWFA-related protein